MYTSVTHEHIAKGLLCRLCRLKSSFMDVYIVGYGPWIQHWIHACHAHDQKDSSFVRQRFLGGCHRLDEKEQNRELIVPLCRSVPFSGHVSCFVFFVASDPPSKLFQRCPSKSQSTELTWQCHCILPHKRHVRKGSKAKKYGDLKFIEHQIPQTCSEHHFSI